ncbi:MAG: TonB-dependent receptor [Steroidobacteraceae bacterium]|jgi:Fe(3+) dicitrate transport protein|nr:TonB-dependent receptor [Steroidobacteraceae bacterium]
MSTHRRLLAAAVCTILATSAARADSPDPAPVADDAAATTTSPELGAARTLAEVVVIGTRENLDKIAGSGEILDRDLLENARVFTINEALRKVPGVYARDEEGMGLRPNIGIRGLNPTRSTKVLLLEDGVPLAYAPYGDNATYYHPPVERFERIEVLKGAGQVAFGPQTIGGVINYITPRPPEDLSGRLTVSGGNRDFREIHGDVGDTVGAAGWLLSATKKESQGSRDNINLDLTDVSGKLTYSINEQHALTLKGSYLLEDSDITYSGLTLAEYEEDLRQNPFVNDDFDLYRWGTSLTHAWTPSSQVELTTSLYYSYFNRDWWRQSSNSGQRPNDASDPACGGMANLNTTCGNEGRLRQYKTYGIEPRLNVRGNWLGLDTEVSTGLRYHEEEQYRLQVNGDTPTARTPGTGVNGGIREDQDRYTDAVSGFVQVSFTRGDFTVTPGIRYEQIDYERVNYLNGTRGTTDLDEWIPGIGAVWQATDTVNVFAGAHRGFAPPRVEDIITPTGGSVDLDAELSWNYELGVRAEPWAGVSLELTAFRMDFENQIVPASVAGGSGATLTSAGETLHQGLEALAEADYPFDNGLAGYVRFAWTYLADAEYRGTRFSSVNPSVSVTGNRLPYAAENTGSLTLGLAGGQWRVQVEGVYTDEMFTDDLNTVPVTANGQRGLIEDHLVWNATVNLYLTEKLDLYATVKNMADEDYVVDMTRGLVPGSPRLVQGGFTMRF